MSKYSKEFKIKLVSEYLDGTSGGRDLIAKKYGVPSSTLSNWIERYKSYGFDRYNKKLSRTEYSSDFKLAVIKYRQIHECSYREAAEHFDLPNCSMVCNWNRIYQEKGFSGLNNLRGRPRKNMTEERNKNDNNQPLNESEREELIRLREENRLLKMKEIYEEKLSALLLEEEAEARKRRKLF